MGVIWHDLTWCHGDSFSKRESTLVLGLTATFGKRQHCRAAKSLLQLWISYSGHTRSNSLAPSGLSFYGFKQTITFKWSKWLEAATLLGTHWAHQLLNTNTCGNCAELHFPWGRYQESLSFCTKWERRICHISWDHPCILRFFLPLAVASLCWFGGEWPLPPSHFSLD